MAREKFSGIYCIENIINHKRYVGLSRDVNKRLAGHKAKLTKGTHDNPHLQSAVNQYGIENFIFYAIERCDRDELNNREIYYIKLYKTRDREYGYNILVGGGGTEGREVTQETREKLSKVGKGKKRSAEFCAHLSSVKKGVPKNVPPEQRAKMILGTIGEKISTRETSSKYRGVYWASRDKRWASYYRRVKIGYFLKEEDAAKSFDKVCWENLHDSNKLNFPEIDYDNFIPQKPLSNKFFKRPNSSSKYIGVCFLKKNKRWLSSIVYDKKTIELGWFKYEVEAALAYNNAAMELYGYNAVLNIISQEEINNLWNLE